MNPSRQNDHDFFPVSFSPYQQISDYLMLDLLPIDGSNNLPNNMTKSRRRPPVSTHKDKPTIDHHTKRIMHRDHEREKRQEMTTFCTSLRNLLPDEYIKGKRSMGDIVHQAVNYIKDKKTKINGLRDRRDELMNPSKSRVVGKSYCENSNNLTPTCVITVRSCLVGVEVVINTTGFGDQVFRLSSMLELLVKEGFNVLTCVSTTVNHRLMYTILSEAEAGDLESIDTLALQNKLMEAIELVSDTSK